MIQASPATLNDAVRRSRGRGRPGTARRRCFISYHRDDTDVVVDLVNEFSDVLLPTALGVTEGADFVASDDQEYIKRRIRELYLASTTVTIVIVGGCTWSRRFIDWEIAATLRDSPRNRRSGLLALTVPGAEGVRLPPRITDNWIAGRPEESYAELRGYPDDATDLREAIDAAFAARTARAHLIDNSRSLQARDAVCM